ncbi:hypothetical protein Gpo141_00012974 [Globisporangium polare]
MQQVFFQQQMISAHERARIPHKRKGGPPAFNGKSPADLEQWIFSTEQYYAKYHEEMGRNSTQVVGIIFGALGPIVQTRFRDTKISLGLRQPAT